MAKKKTIPAETLKGWTAIAKFLGTSPTSAQTWAKQGMPVKREGRFTIAAALKESISVVKREK